MKRNNILIGIIILGILGVSYGVLLPTRVGLIFQELSSLAIFIPVLYFSRLIKAKNKVGANILLFISVFFLIAITISLVGTFKLLLS
ncbi:MAG: hypothetical protein K0R46_3136 [Herbinix sp.]|jgi:hypothetical protein|nr:hypothetical protein [Herbinix sp.]